MTETTHGNGSLRAVVGGAEALLDRAGRAAVPTEFVITPERLHRRNLKRRLAEQATSRSSLRLTDATAVAADLLETATRGADTIDRIDRLKHLESLLERETDETERLRAVFGSELVGQVETVAAAHSRVGEMTGWDSNRLDSLSAVTEGLPYVAKQDTADTVAGVRAIEQGLQERVGPVHSRETLLPEAAAALQNSPTLWAESFPATERLSVAGVSAVDAPLLVLLSAVASAGVDVTLSLRPGTGPAIIDRLDGRLGSTVTATETAGAGLPTERSATEFVADTPESEARLAAAIVAGHLRNGVSPSDVLVVARDAGEYERPLRRAAKRHAVHLAVWAQLPVEQTIPYRLFASVCAVLGADSVGLDDLLAPLEFRWVPPAFAADTADSSEPSADPDMWPLPPNQIGTLRTAIGAPSDAIAHSLDDWERQLADAVDTGALDSDSARPLERFLSWLGQQPTVPGPAAVHQSFEPVVSASREVVLPAVFESDTAEISRTARFARALSRIEELLTDTRAKYDKWLAAGDVPRSWLAIADLAEQVVRTRPGRREHANAAAVDVIDGTDAWLREVPHVVAVGLVDDIWPRRPESVLPETLRRAVVAGDSPAARQLAVPGRWTAARETDHLASGLGAATSTLACTRYRRDREGTTRERSPLLSTVPTHCADDTTVQSLLTTGTLPNALAADGDGSQ